MKIATAFLASALAQDVVTTTSDLGLLGKQVVVTHELKNFRERKEKEGRKIRSYIDRCTVGDVHSPEV